MRNTLIVGLACLALTLGLIQISSADGVIGDILEGTLNGTPTIILNPNYADAGLTVPQYIAKYGYPVEVHYVTTSDGYILALHRIPSGKAGPSTGPKPVAYLQHGLVSSSASWTQNGPGQSLAFILADLGYDVWLGNFRGNTYSRNHTTLNPNTTSGLSADFWQFTFHENGKYDIPSIMNYILAVTHEVKLTYVGHSMGTTSMFVALSLDPSLNAKIKLFIALAPVVYLTNTLTPLRLIAPLIINGVTNELLTSLGPGEFQPNNQYMSEFKSLACATAPTADLICGNLFFLIMGFDIPQLNTTQLPVYNSNYPQGSSLKTFIHYAQFMNKQSFRQYDYGLVKNLLTYGWVTPPTYDLTKTTVPTAIYYGANDWLADKKDAEILINSNLLPNLVKAKLIDWDLWMHADFIWAIDINKYLNNDLIALMMQYQ